MEIRQIRAEDIVSITDIYNWYILQTRITFEKAAISSQVMHQRVQQQLEHHDWLVGTTAQKVIGYAYYGAFSPRAAYAHTVESTIYLAPDQTGQGWGTRLYRALLNSAQQKGFRELVGKIALPNPASIRLHQTLGFVEVGVLQQVGYKFGHYIDVGIWQKSLR